MTETPMRQIENQSAKIYQFPDRRRARLGMHADAIDTAAMRAPAVAPACGWYHDAAIAEANTVRKT